MSETVKLIIEIPKGLYEMCKKYELYTSDSETLAIAHGIPLDDVKAEIETNLSWEMFDEYGNETGLHKELMEILDNIGKGDDE